LFEGTYSALYVHVGDDGSQVRFSLIFVIILSVFNYITIDIKAFFISENGKTKKDTSYQLHHSSFPRKQMQPNFNVR